MKKRQKDQFSLTLTGVIIFSVILIGIVFGTYLLVKNLFSKSEVRAAEAATEAYEKELRDAEEKALLRAKLEPEPTPTPTPTPEPEPEPEPLHTEEIDLTNVDVHSFVDNNNRVSYLENRFGVGKRDERLTTDMEIFNRLEKLNDPEKADINRHTVKRISATNDSDNEVEFLVYTDPDNGQTEKIISRENCGDYFRITDYYYSDGRIKYADEYDQTVIYPVDISSASVRARYYINMDCLVEYVYCENDKATVYRLSELSEYSKGTAEQYDYLEKEIINRAYITYYACQNMSDDIVISGYVQDELNQPLSDVTVEFYAEGNDARAALTKTNGDGFYTFTAPSGKEAEYRISLKKKSLEDVTIYGIKIPKGCGDIYADTAYMGYLDNKGKTRDVQIVIKNAADNTTPVSDGQVKLRSGINNRNGEVISTFSLDPAGSAVVPLYSSEYTAEITKSGYETAYVRVCVKQDHNAVTGYAIPELPENTYTAVISWETSPLDLDSRVFGQYGKPSDRSATDSTGLVTAECLGISDAGSKEYKIYLSDYGNASAGNNMVYNMSDSGAVVDIYSHNGLETSFRVPAAHAGTVWDVCTIRNKTIIPDNIYYYVLNEGSLFAAK